MDLIAHREMLERILQSKPGQTLTKQFKKNYALLKSNHTRDYQSLFKRVELDLGVDPATLKLPTDQRLRQYKTSPNDFQLQALYYQFGRYLLIASSRPGSRPANLQGIWNDHVQPTWGINYTTNINTEMNYWLEWGRDEL